MIQIKKRRGSLDMFSIAICDDEKAICAQLEQIFQEYMDRGIDTEVFFSIARNCTIHWRRERIMI